MGKTIAITGANSGIGKALAYNIAEKGNKIILIARKSTKTNEVYDDLKTKFNDEQIKLITGDLSDPEDIKDILNKLYEVDGIDVLINNAGLLKLKKVITKENIEMTMSVNYLATYRITMGLILAGKQPKRIVTMSSELFKKGKLNFDQLFNPAKYKGADAYNNSKKAIIAFSKELYKRYSPSVEVVALHPGVVATGAAREYPKWIISTMNKMLEKPDDAAAKIVKVVLSDDVSSGHYYNQDKINEKFDAYIDDESSTQLFEISKKYLLENNRG